MKKQKYIKLNIFKTELNSITLIKKLISSLVIDYWFNDFGNDFDFFIIGLLILNGLTFFS